MKPARERLTIVEPPSPELLKATREESGVYPLPITLPPEEPRPTLEMPFLSLVRFTVGDLEQVIHRTPMDHDEKQRLFPLLWEMTRSEELAMEVLKAAFLYGEPYSKQVRDEKWLIARLSQADPVTLLEYVRDVVPLLHIDLPAYREGERLDESDRRYHEEERAVAQKRVMGEAADTGAEDRPAPVLVNNKKR